MGPGMFSEINDNWKKNFSDNKGNFVVMTRPADGMGDSTSVGSVMFESEYRLCTWTELKG